MILRLEHTETFRGILFFKNNPDIFLLEMGRTHISIHIHQHSVNVTRRYCSQWGRPYSLVHCWCKRESERRKIMLYCWETFHLLHTGWSPYDSKYLKYDLPGVVSGQVTALQDQQRGIKLCLKSHCVQVLLQVSEKYILLMADLKWPRWKACRKIALKTKLWQEKLNWLWMNN